MIADELAGRVALITGAARGLGLAAAERFLAGGARVVVNVRRPEQAAAVAARLDESGGGRDRVPVPPGHRASSATGRALVARKLPRLRRLHILVYHAPPSLATRL